MFGFFDGQPYGLVTDKYEDFKEIKNAIDKENVIKHIESLEAWLSSAISKDIFTGEEFGAGFYIDGDFQFPIDFLRYYKRDSAGTTDIVQIRLFSLSATLRTARRIRKASSSKTSAQPSRRAVKAACSFKGKQRKAYAGLSAGTGVQKAEIGGKINRCNPRNPKAPRNVEAPRCSFANRGYGGFSPMRDAVLLFHNGC